MEKFKAVKLLSESNISRTFKTIKVDTKQQLTIKKIRTNPSSEQNPLKKRVIDVGEKQFYILKRIKHPNIVECFDYIKSDKVSYLIMEPLEYSLQQYLDLIQSQGLRLGEKEVTFIFRQICQAVAYLQENLISHGDVSVKNVFFNKERRVKLGNFSLSKSWDPADPFFERPDNYQQAPNSSSFSAAPSNCQPFYCAPEVCLRMPCPYRKADAFALGCLIPQLFNCKPLLGGDTQVNQLHQYCIILGTPEQIEWPDGHAVASKLRIVMPESQGIELEGLVAGASREILEVMRQLSRVNPIVRNSGREILTFLGQLEAGNREAPAGLNGQKGKQKKNNQKANQRYASAKSREVQYENQLNRAYHLNQSSSPSSSRLRNQKPKMNKTNLRNSTARSSLTSSPRLFSQMNSSEIEAENLSHSPIIYTKYHQLKNEKRQRTSSLASEDLSGHSSSFHHHHHYHHHHHHNTSNSPQNGISTPEQTFSAIHQRISEGNMANGLSYNSTNPYSAKLNLNNFQTKESRETHFITQDSRGSIYTRESQISQANSAIINDPPSNQRYGGGIMNPSSSPIKTSINQHNLGHLMFMRSHQKGAQSTTPFPTQDSRISIIRSPNQTTHQQLQQQQHNKLLQLNESIQSLNHQQLLQNNDKNFYLNNKSITNLDDGWDKQTRNSNSVRDFDLRSNQILIPAAATAAGATGDENDLPPHFGPGTRQSSRPALSQHQSNRIINELRKKRELLNGKAPALELQNPSIQRNSFYADQIHHPHNNKKTNYCNKVLKRSSLDHSFDPVTHTQAYISPLSSRHANKNFDGISAINSRLPSFDKKILRMSTTYNNKSSVQNQLRESVAAGGLQVGGGGPHLNRSFDPSQKQRLFLDNPKNQQAFVFLPNSNEVLPVIITPRKTPQFNNKRNTRTSFQK